jgi:hypothetical protein
MFRVGIAGLALIASHGALAGDEPYPTLECIQQLAHEARLQVLDGKVALGHSEETTYAMLALDRPATTEESLALALWSDLRQACFALGAPYRSAAGTERGALAGRLFAVQQRLLGELCEGRIGYAEFNARRFELWAAAARREEEIRAFRGRSVPGAGETRGRAP